MSPSVEQQISQLWPPKTWRDVIVVVAVSGGADSVAMLRALMRLGDAQHANLVLAHFNHRLRPQAATDEQFVAKLGRQLQLRCEIGHSDADLADVSDGSIEEAAREARYRFLASVAQRYGARFVATAHTADDQAETILQRILRGTGIAGLAGIPPTRELVPGTTLIRPLLSCRRSEIIEYLHGLGQSYVEDGTNCDNRFSRNRIRNELLPQLAEQYNQRVDEAILRLGSLAAETSSYIDGVADLWVSAHALIESNAIELNCTELRQLDPLIARTVLLRIWRRMGWPEQDMGYAKWEQLASFATKPTGQQTVLLLPGGIRAEKHGDKRAVLSRA